MNNDNNRLVGLLVVVAVLIGLLVGGTFGVIAWSGNHQPGAAIRTGGGACVATITLCILIINTVVRNRR